jgi:hypothetical protein
LSERGWSFFAKAATAASVSGPIFNAANDAVEQALSKTSLAELVRSVGKICLKL